MKRIVSIVPASPGWYARWRLTSQGTQSCPLTVWALVEDAGASTRHIVVGVDAGGQWPGGVDNDSGTDFIRYIYLAPDEGQPEDVFNPAHPVPESRT